MDMDKSSISENIQESHCQPVDAVVRDYGSGPYVVHAPLQEASAGGADAVARISEDKALCVGSKTPSKGGGPDVIIPKVRTIAWVLVLLSYSALCGRSGC